MLFCARLATALAAVLVLGLGEASACGCGCCRGPQPVPAPSRVVFAPAPGFELAPGFVAPCCSTPAPAPTVPAAAAGPAAPAPVPATDKKEADKKDDMAEIRENLGKLSPEDRKLAETQKWCVIENDNRLGEMGVPVKIMVKDQPVFLCCPGCKKEALADPDKTLAKVKELKARAKTEEKK